MSTSLKHTTELFHKDHSPPPAIEGLEKPYTHVHGNIQSLTSLRFLAVLCVVFNHGKTFFHCWQDFDYSLNLSQVVCFFFVLSGFVLTLNSSRFHGLKDVGRFYLSRAIRIWPAHIFSLVLLLLLIPEAFRIRVETIPLLLSNLFLVHSWIPLPQAYFSYNAPSWSTSTIVFFYLCFPLLLAIAYKRWSLVLFGGICLVAGMIILSEVLGLPAHDWQRLSIKSLVYINPLARLLEFIVGILTAMAFKHSVHKVKVSRLQATLLELSLITLIVAISLNSNSWSITVSQHLSAPLGEWLRNSGLIMVPFALLIGILSLQRGVVSQALRFPFLLTLGESSFAIYMLHVVLLTHRSVRFPQDQSFGASLMYLALLILTAHLFTTLIERPLRKLVTNIRDYRFRIAVPNLVLCKILILLLVISLGFPKAQALSPQEAEYNANGALVRNIDFLPEVRCVSAVARHDGEHLIVKIVWQALYDQCIEFVNTVKLIDNTGKEIRQIAYQHDPAKRAVKADEMWLDQIQVSAPPSKSPSHVELFLVTTHYQSPTALKKSWHQGPAPYDRLVIPILNKNCQAIVHSLQSGDKEERN